MVVTDRSVAKRTVAQLVESATHYSVSARTIRHRLQQIGLSANVRSRGGRPRDHILKADVLQLIYKQEIVNLISSRALGHSFSKKVTSRLIRSTQRRFLLRIIKGYKTIIYEAVFAISGIPPIDLILLNSLVARENYLSTSLGTLDWTIPVPLLPHSSCRKPITLVTYTNYKSSKNIKLFISQMGVN
ncbi:hypothetical protein TNCV_4918841 [Trichonephila clavipes]|nr:hypothetical protein TNCV_4918841 [Trichonephila clavipes]